MEKKINNGSVKYITLIGGGYKIMSKLITKAENCHGEISR